MSAFELEDPTGIQDLTRGGANGETGNPQRPRTEELIEMIEGTDKPQGSKDGWQEQHEDGERKPAAQE